MCIYVLYGVNAHMHVCFCVMRGIVGVYVWGCMCGSVGCVSVWVLCVSVSN